MCNPSLRSKKTWPLCVKHEMEELLRQADAIKIGIEKKNLEFWANLKFMKMCIKKQKRAERRAARKAAEAAQAANDAINDAQDRQYREDVAVEDAEIQEEIAASNAAIVQALQDEDEGTCKAESTQDLVVDVPEKVPPVIRQDDFEFLSALFFEYGTEDFKISFQDWLPLFNGCADKPRKWYNRLRYLFPCFTEVPDDILSQAVLAKIVTSTGFEIGKWKYQLREIYCIPGRVLDEGLLSAVLTRIDFMFARNSEVHEMILGTK